MSDDQDKIDDETEGRGEARRRFLKTAGQVAVMTPAVTLLLSGKSKAEIYVPVSPMFKTDAGQDPGPFPEDTDADLFVE